MIMYMSLYEPMAVQCDIEIERQSEQKREKMFLLLRNIQLYITEKSCISFSYI